jgi:hypothetical protein
MPPFSAMRINAEHDCRREQSLMPTGIGSR